MCYRNIFCYHEKWNVLWLWKSNDKYINYYNKKRIIIKLKGLTPLEYRHQSLN
ncbi:IS3 family transposase [Mycoplasmopsis bovirhinis]|uniref:IS3 family transposase n=1 Tax=Mycoplasmopsis bovirhinis TaxID=29553 RepID=UPI000E7222D4